MAQPKKTFKFKLIAAAVFGALTVMAAQKADAQVTAQGGCNNYTPMQGDIVSCSPELSTATSGVQTPEKNTGNNDVTVRVFPETVLSVNGSTIGLGSGSKITNEGTLFTQSFRYGYGMSAGVNGRSTAGGNTLTNESAGIILTNGNDAHGMYVNARQSSATSNTITNKGSVTTTGNRSDGIRLYTESTTATDSILTEGSIETSGEDASGIHVQNTQTVTEITNKGSITVNDPSGHGIYIEGAADVTNSGTIAADASGYAIYVVDNGNTNANTVTLSGNEVNITGALQFSTTRTSEKLVFEGIGSEDTPFDFNNAITGLNAIEISGGQSYVNMGSAGGYDLVNAQMTIGSNSELKITSDIGGSGGLTKNGLGTLRLSGTNTYSGVTQLDEGGLIIESGNAISSGNLVIEGFEGLGGSGVLLTGGITLDNNIQSGTSVNAGQSALLYAAPSGSLDGMTPDEDAPPESNTVSGAVTLNKNLVLASAAQSELVMAGAIDATSGGGQGLSLFNIGGKVIFSGGIGQNEALGSVSFGGASELASNVTTTGSQSYAAAVTLGTDVTLDGKDIGSTGSINGAHGLTITDIGNTSLADVGDITALSSIAVTAKSITLSDVTTTGDQTYTTTGGATDIIQTNSTYTTKGGDITFDGAVQANDALIVNTIDVDGEDVGNVAFESTLDSEDGETNAVTISAGDGTITFAGAVGETTPLGSLTINSGVTHINGGSVTTTGTQTYSDTVNLGAETTLTVAGLSAQAIELGAFNLTVEETGTGQISGVISGTSSLTKTGTGTLTLSGVNTYSGQTTVSGGTLKLGVAGAVPTNTLTIGTDGTFDLNNFNQTVTDLSGSGAVTLGTATLTAGSTTDTTFSGVISGNGGLTKVGTGTLTLSGINTYTGITTINGGGVLKMGADNVLSSNTDVTINNGTLDLANTDQTIGSLESNGNVLLGSGTLTTGGNNLNRTFGGVISGTGDLVKVGTATLTLTGANTYSGGTTVNGGTLKVGASGAVPAGALTVGADGTFDLNNFAYTATELSGSGAVTLGNATLTAGSTADTTFSGIISGDGGLTKVGAGTLTLSGVNTYTGATTISSGTLQMGAAGAVPTSALEVQSGSTFDLNNFNQTVTDLSGSGSVTLGNATLTAGSTADTTFSGVISGDGGLTKAGAGTLTLSGANTYTGTTTVADGILKLGVVNALIAGALEVQSAGTFDLNDFDHTVTDLNGAGSVALGSATLTTSSTTDTTFSGVISGDGGLTKAGTGTLTLSGVNTYSGGTTLSVGTLALESGSSVGAGTIALGNDTTLAMNKALTVANAITVSGSATIATGANAVIASGVIGGSGRLIKTGTGALTLAANNTYAGGTALQAGTIVVESDTALGTGTVEATGSGVVLQAGKENLTLANAVTVTEDLIVDTAGEVVLLSGSVTGAGRLIKRGTGTLELAGENSFSGGTEVESGTLALDVNAASSTGEVVMAADTQVKADTTLSLDNVFKLRGPVEFNTQGFDLTLNNTVSNNSVGQLIKTGTGTLTLNGTNDYSGGTIIQAGTLALYGTLASGVEIQSGTTFGGAGTVTGDVSNAGMIQPRLNGSRSILTIVGNYVGQDGNFASTLGGSRDAIVADRLAISGAGNTASGTTTITVSDPTGVLGKPTIGDGILLVGVTDGATSTSTAFTAPRIAAGAYEYKLTRGGEDSAESWYLRADANEPQPPVVVTPEASQREEVALYPSLPSLARQYLWSINGTLDDRRGAPDVIGQWDKQPVAWGRLIAQHNETKPGNVNDGPGLKANDWGLQLGADLWRSDSAWGQWRVGPVMTIGRSTGSANNATGSVKTGNVSLNAYSLGLNATVASSQGAYADLLLLGTRLTGVKADSPLGTSINTTGWALSGSVEGGWRLPLNDKFALTPQAQVYTTTVNLSDSADAYSQVQMPTETTVLGRLGLKLSYDNIQATGPRTQLWARASVYSTLSGKDASTSFLNLQGTNATTFQSQAPGTWMALEAAVNVQASDNTSVQVGLGYQSTFDNQYRGIYGQVNVRWGF